MQHERATADDPLLEGYHHVRMLTERDAPWPGRLVRLPDGDSCVFVDAAALGDGWGGWRADPHGHILTPMDVVRRRDGHDAAMPVCLERVDAFLLRRCGDQDPVARADLEVLREPLDEGETVTLAVSLLRGAAEAARTQDEPGEWWLTDAGRPALALTRVRGSTAAELLMTIAGFASARLAPVVREAAGAAADARLVVRDLERLEASLFEAAEPKPLAVHGHSPLATSAAARTVGPDPAVASPPSWIDALGRHVDADLSALASDILDRVRRRLVRRRLLERSARVRERSTVSRRRPWLVAAGIAGGLLGIGMLWPTGGGPATADEAGHSPGAATPSAMTAPASDAAPMPGPGVGDPAESAAPVDWVAGTTDLLARRVACASDSECLATVLEDPTRSIPSGAVDTSDREVALLDEFGGAAVLRVQSSTSGSAQLAVVVQANGSLLLREVHDIAEQKG